METGLETAMETITLTLRNAETFVRFHSHEANKHTTNEVLSMFLKVDRSRVRSPAAACDSEILVVGIRWRHLDCKFSISRRLSGERTTQRTNSTRRDHETIESDECTVPSMIT